MMPGGFEREVCVDDDFRNGFSNMMDHEFTGNCGHVYANSKAGPFTLHVHSNLCYTLRFKQAPTPSRCLCSRGNWSRTTN